MESGGSAFGRKGIEMVITKRFKFYAAHRNEEIGGKCGSIHGHRYGIAVTVAEPRNGSITILFADIDSLIDPIIAELDHSLLMHENDPARESLQISGACCRMYLVPFVTSAENMAEHLLDRIRATGLNVTRLELQETDSSTVVIEK